MKTLELWFYLTILFRLTAAAALINDPMNLHRRIIASIRAENVDQLAEVVVSHPETIQSFNLAYWFMALFNLNDNPESLDRHLIVQILLNGLENKNRAKGEYTPLIMATLSGSMNVIKSVLKVANVDGLNQRGESALISAIRDGKLSAALELIEHGANVDIFDKSGLNALHYATRIQNPTVRSEAIWLLLSNGADVFWVDYPKYKIYHQICDLRKSFNTADVTVELAADELLLRRLYVDFEEKANNFALFMFFLACAVLKASLHR